jgi:hypothetical protein
MIAARYSNSSERVRDFSGIRGTASGGLKLDLNRKNK